MRTSFAKEKDRATGVCKRSQWFIGAVSAGKCAQAMTFFDPVSSVMQDAFVPQSSSLAAPFPKVCGPSIERWLSAFHRCISFLRIQVVYYGRQQLLHSKHTKEDPLSKQCGGMLD